MSQCEGVNATTPHGIPGFDAGLNTALLQDYQLVTLSMAKAEEWKDGPNEIEREI